MLTLLIFDISDSFNKTEGPVFSQRTSAKQWLYFIIKRWLKETGQKEAVYLLRHYLAGNNFITYHKGELFLGLNLRTVIWRGKREWL